MEFNHLKTGKLLFLMVFTLLITLSFAAEEDYSNYIVENLQVNDIPNDDGGGLVLSWKPLPKERRIIEYRIYRGVSPDTLFFHGKVDVNVKTGVSGDELFYYDSGYNMFVNLQSPGKLKKEEQQSPESPLFLSYPRDITVSGPRLKNYRILGVIPEKDFYYRNTKVEIEEDDETEVYAGYKLRHFKYLLKKLIADKEYFYTVLAVTESRKFMPHAKIVSGIPRDDSPEAAKEFFPVFVKDKKILKFEWTRAIFTTDHSNHNLYLIHKDDLETFNDFVQEQINLEELSITAKEDSLLEIPEAKYTNPAKLIFTRYSGYPYTANNTVSIPIKDNLIADEENEIEVEIDPTEMTDYRFVFSFADWNGFETFSEVKKAKEIYSADLPKLPAEWKVTDRADDKGDYNTISWGKPSVLLTNTSYLNEEKTKLLVNYDVYTNKNYKTIKNVYFQVYDMHGNMIDEINEFYQDKKIKIKLPHEMNEITFKMWIKANGYSGKDQLFTQKLIYDENSKSMQPGKLYLDNEEVNRFSYSIYKRNYSNEEWRLSKSTMGSQRELFDNIAYELDHFKSVSKFDLEKKLFLVSPTFSIRMDDKLENSIVANLYPSEQKKSIENYQKEIEKYEAQKDTASAEEIAKFDRYIEHYQNQLKIAQENPILKTAAEINGKKARLKYLEKARKIGSRSFEYKIVKSDGKGIFTESEVYQAEKIGNLPFTKKTRNSFAGLGKNHFYPLPNWFQSNKFATLIATLIFGYLVFTMIQKAKKGKDLYIRPIAGISEIDNAIGRATEMGRPILYVPGLSGIGDVATLAGLSLLGRVAKKAAEYDTRILVPVRDYIVLPIAQEIVKEAHYEAGRPDTYDNNSVFFITTSQFAFVAGVNGIMIREKTATNFYMGMFWAEALLMTETGSMTGAIQISGTDAVTQIPFFITTCDYTLIGEELYAASAYLAKEPLQLGTLKAVDYLKFIIIIFVIGGTILSTFHATFLINSFPEK